MSKRLLKDLKEVKEDTEWHFTADPVDNDLSRIVATFPGPEKSPYAGGTFTVEFNVPIEYPLKAPKARFATRIYHPNISSQNGAICLDLLGKSWSPVYKINSILIALQQLLDSPNPDDPQDSQVASVYTANKPLFEETAKEWTAKYAHPAGGPKVDEASLNQFVQMGFPKEKVASVFESLGLTKIGSDAERESVLNKLIS